MVFAFHVQIVPPCGQFMSLHTEYLGLNGLNNIRVHVLHGYICFYCSNRLFFSSNSRVLFTLVFLTPQTMCMSNTCACKIQLLLY